MYLFPKSDNVYGKVGIKTFELRYPTSVRTGMTKITVTHRPKTTDITG